MKSPVIFVIPPSRQMSVSYPLGIAYISALLKQNNYQFKILDYSLGSHSLSTAIKEIIGLNPAILGFSISTFSYNTIKEMILKIKSSIRDVKIIVGGPHVSALPKFTIEDLKADFAVVGEAELVTLEIIKRLESGNEYFDDINGLAFWKDGEAILKTGINLIDNLDALPFPGDGFDSFDAYRDVCGHVYSRYLPVGPVLTTRGCPHQCTFCASYQIHGRKLRKRSVKNVVDEIEFLTKNYGIKEINFIDDTFSEERTHAINVCEEIMKRGIHIAWRPSVGVRLDTLDDELLKIFKLSGCYQLGFGIESFSGRILKSIKKSISLEQVIDKINLVKKYDIETMGFFILGLPGDTQSSIMNTIKFARKSKLDFLNFAHFIPFPGTEIFRENCNGVNLKDINWEDFHTYNNNPFDICALTPRKLKQLYFFSYIFSYLTPKRMVKIFKSLLNGKKVNVRKLFKFVNSILKNVS